MFDSYNIFDERWMLNRGDHINMFVCTVKSVYKGH
jgi:hypothetical protein